MQKLFENWRGYLKEVGDPDNPSDNEPSTQEMAKELEKRQIAKVVDDFGFNPGWKEQKDLIHWEVGAPIIEYEYKSDGTFDYKATIPDGQDPKNWKEILSDPEETIEAFLTRIKKLPHQLSLSL